MKIFFKILYLKINIMLFSSLFIFELLKIFNTAEASIKSSSCTIDSNYKLMSTKTAYEVVANTSNFESFFIPSITF